MLEELAVESLVDKTIWLLRIHKEAGAHLMQV